MSAFNIVKFKIKDGQEDAFLAAHSDGKARWPGLIRGTIIKTGERNYCLIGEWPSTEALMAARSAMIQTLDSFRATLEDMGDGRGTTDATSGKVVMTLT